MSLLRIAAIDFLNPAPLMWNFEHPPAREALLTRYSIQKMSPSECARRLAAGNADLGLIPIAAYPTLPNVAVVPGSAIASLGAIRSLLLVLRQSPARPGGPPASTIPEDLTPEIRAALRLVASVALDTSSRASAAYTRILFKKYWGGSPQFLPSAPALDAMLKVADAALLIGDPALFALEDSLARERRTGERLHYLDLGAAWRAETGLPWVSAFWAARVQALGGPEGAHAVVADLSASRDAGLAHLPELAEEWSARLGLPRPTVAGYLGENIHYHLDAECLLGVERFFADAQECGLIAETPALTFL